MLINIDGMLVVYLSIRECKAVKHSMGRFLLQSRAGDYKMRG